MRAIRRARPADAAALSELAMRSKAFWGYDTVFMEACREALATTVEAILENEIWIVEAGGIAAGFYEIGVDDANCFGEIRMCFVDPDVIRQGIGGILWRHLETRAMYRRLTRIGLDADPNAVPFYSAMGMEIVGEAPSGQIAGRMLPRMEKSL